MLEAHKSVTLTGLQSGQGEIAPKHELLHGGELRFRLEVANCG
jgi:hypothetical protein